MHKAAFEWVRDHAPAHEVSVIDVGGRDINGTVRGLFLATQYVSVDLFAGSCVDIVCDFREYLPPEPVDVVVCCEVAEHTVTWPQVVAHAAYCLASDGLLIFTAAGPARRPHSAFDGGAVRDGEHYENVTPERLSLELGRWFHTHEIDVTGEDIRAVAWR